MKYYEEYLDLKQEVNVCVILLAVISVDAYLRLYLHQSSNIFVVMSHISKFLHWSSMQWNTKLELGIFVDSLM
jgi:hypothetical protein